MFKRQKKDPEVERVYKDTYAKTYREERLKVAEERAKKAATSKAHAKPFYQKLGDAFTPASGGKKGGGDIGKFLNDMAFGPPAPKQRKRRKK